MSENADSRTPGREEPNVKHLCDWAWSIIANVGWGDWSAQPADWREAAEKWRDEYAGLSAPSPSPAEDGRLRAARQAFEAIIVRCTEGDKRTDWLPVITGIAKEGLAALRAATSPVDTDELRAQVLDKLRAHAFGGRPANDVADEIVALKVAAASPVETYENARKDSIPDTISGNVAPGNSDVLESDAESVVPSVRIPVSVDASPVAPQGTARDERCPECGATETIERKCKILCAKCLRPLRDCSDL